MSTLLSFMLLKKSNNISPDQKFGECIVQFKKILQQELQVIHEKYKMITNWYKLFVAINIG